MDAKMVQRWKVIYTAVIVLGLWLREEIFLLTLNWIAEEIMMYAICCKNHIVILIAAYLLG